ncbi:Rho GTPase-activating protein 21 [Apophysomyces sp. BC1034]|nr:Rho GTPase-activating protein 21 [Apophysomyces sp. BC1034]
MILDSYTRTATEESKDTMLVDTTGEPGDLPDGWKHTYDEDGTIYYFNEYTGESRWEKPEALLSSTHDATIRLDSMTLQPSEDFVQLHEGLQKLSPAELKKLEYDQLHADWIRQQGLVQMKMKAGKEDGGKLSSWKLYYAVLSNGFLLLYKDSVRGKKPPKPLLPVGSFDLDSCQIEPASKQDTRRKHVFLITTPSKVTIYIQTTNDKDFSSWLDAIMRELIARKEGQSEASNGTSKILRLLRSLTSNSEQMKVNRKLDTGIKDSDEKDRKYPTEKPKHRHWFSKSGRGSEKLQVQSVAEQTGSSTGNDVFGGFLRLNDQGNVPSIVRMESVDETVSFAEEHDINVMTGLLKLYFRELRNPLFTYEYYDWFIEAARIPDYDERMFRIKSIIHVLPKANYTVLEYLMRHLHRVTLYSEVNKMEASNLALIFSVGLLRSSSEDLSSIMHADLLNKIIEAIIQQVDWFFEVEDADGLEREPLTAEVE